MKKESELLPVLLPMPRVLSSLCSLGVPNDADLVPLACEDASCEEFHLNESMALFS